MSIKTAKAKAWKTFSEYIRLRDSRLTTGTDDLCMCVTCGKVLPTWGGQIHAGHTIPGRSAGILFDDKGVNGQCGGCNGRGGGKPAEYAVWYINKYGIELFEDMVRRKNKPHRWTVGELEGINELYKGKVKELRA